MKLDYVPLLPVQRQLQGMPRGMERFQEYLRTIITADGTGLELPSLIMMNPMGKEHVTALLDEYLALDADGIAAGIVAEVSQELADDPGDFKLTMILADDLRGGWTNRYDYEFTQRFKCGPPPPESRLPRWAKHFWLNAVLWTSEPASRRAVREAVLTTLYRAAYVLRHGPARTLREMLLQEGQVMRRAGCVVPMLDAEDITYTREVIAPHLETTDRRLTMECLFGDEAGRTLGFTPRGLSHWAGLALARHDAGLQK